MSQTKRHTLLLRAVISTALLLGSAPWAGAQEPTEDPARAEGETTTPRSVVPPEAEGEGDSWGYARTEESGETVEDPLPRRATVVKARLVGPSGHRYVKEIARLRDDVGRLEPSRQGDRMAFEKVTDRGFRGLHVGTLTSGFDRCLTCESWDLRKSHVLAPTWHPSGRVLVAMVQGPAEKLGLDPWGLAGPDRGLHSELWAFTADGRDAWQLTQVVGQGGAVLDPRFSHEGGRLAWTQRVDTTKGGRWGSWEVRVAEFEIKRGLPRLGKVRQIDALPWPGLVSIHGFTDDDQGLWLTVTPAPGSSRRGFTTALYDLQSETFEPLSADGQWDALPSGIPRSERRVWVSDRGIERPAGARLPWRGDLWLSSRSGLRQERLTYFNDPKSDHYLGEAWIADTEWSTDGESVWLLVLTPETGGEIVEYLYRVTLDPAIGQ